MAESGQSPPTLRRQLFFFLRRKDNCDLHAFEARSEFGRAAVGQVFFEPVEQLNAEFLVRYLAATEPDRRFHLIPVGQNLPGMLHLEIVVVLIGGGAKLNLLDLDDDLFLLGLVRPLLLLVKILAEVNDATDRRLGLGRDFDQVVAALASNPEGLLRRHNAKLLPLLIDYPHFFRANTLVDANTGASLIAPPSKTALITVADKNT